jgi:hypothetical protein
MNIANHKTSVLITAICFLFFFVACNRKIKTDDNAILFDTIQVNKIHYLNNDSSKFRCNLQISFVYPQSDNVLEKQNNLQTIFIENVLSESFGELSPQEAIDSYTNQYLKNFGEFNIEDFSENYSLTDETGFSYFLDLKDRIVYNKNNFISFIVESQNYEGGAHGAHSMYGYVINLNTGELLNEETFSGTNYKNNLLSVMLQKVAEANGVEDAKQLENIGYNIDEIKPNGNFTIDDKGITYYFNEYEIASYYVGITKVFISYEELKVFIAEDSPISSLARGL